MEKFAHMKILYKSTSGEDSAIEAGKLELYVNDNLAFIITQKGDGLNIVKIQFGDGPGDINIKPVGAAEVEIG